MNARHLFPILALVAVLALPTVALAASPDPSQGPSTAPSSEPSSEPSSPPSEEPSEAPSEEPSTPPSEQPTATPSPTPSPTPVSTPRRPTLPPTDQDGALGPLGPQGPVVTADDTPAGLRAALLLAIGAAALAIGSLWLRRRRPR